MSRESRKEYRAYRKRLNKTRKRLTKEAKEWQSFDESYLFALMRIVFEDWQSYYHDRNCVWASDWENIPDDAFCPEPCPPSREKIATELLRLLDKMNDNGDVDTVSEFDNATKEFADYFATYVHYMWD